MTRLKRSIGLPLLLFYGLGNILGAGIYVLIGKVAGEAGMYVPLAFFTAFIVAAFSAFTYSELSARYPLSAGAAVYVDEGFHSASLARLTGVLIGCSGMVSAATISRGFYGYFSTFLPLPEVLVIASIILLLGALTMWGISQSVGFAASLTVIEIVGLLLVVWVGKDALATLPARIDTLIPPMQSSAMIGILLGSFLAFFAYIGFEDMVNIAEEVKNPQRNLPAAILLALLIASLMYASVALIAVLSLDQDTLSASQAPLADVLAATSDMDPRIISMISMIAIVNGALIQMIMASRLFYGMAVKGWLWHKLAKVNAKTRTPINATALVVVLTLGLALWIPLETLARGTSYLVLVVFALANAALLMIKRTQSTPEGIINNPLWVPALGLFSSLGLVLFQLIRG